MMTPARLLSTLVVPLCSVAGAQTAIVVPPQFASAEAESFTGLPFGRSTPVRVQHYYGARWFPVPVTIDAVAFRADGDKAFGEKGVDVEVWLATGPIAADAVSASFGTNRGNDFVSCFTRKTIKLPQVAQVAGPRPFSLSFALDKSFVYDPARGGLLVEILVYGQQPGAYEIDLGQRCSSARASFGKPACKGSNGRAPIVDCATESLMWGSPFVMRVRDALPNGVGVLFLGTAESGTWLGLTIPYALDPIGAPGCTLNTDPWLSVGVATDGNGEARTSGRVPADASLLGAWLRFQAAMVDLSANALGIVMSNGSKTEICGPVPLARVVTTSPTAASGQLEIGVGPVTQLTLR